MGDKGDEAKPASGSASAEDQDVDPRLDFLSDYILKSLRVKLEKWQKMMSTGDMKQMVLDFCDKPDGPELLVIMQNNAGERPPRCWAGMVPQFSAYGQGQDSLCMQTGKQFCAPTATNCAQPLECSSVEDQCPSSIKKWKARFRSGNRYGADRFFKL